MASGTETAPAVDKNAIYISVRGITAHHDIDVAALLEVRIEDRLADRAPGRLGLPGESAILH
jgi:hypothetical protein